MDYVQKELIVKESKIKDTTDREILSVRMLIFNFGIETLRFWPKINGKQVE